MAKKKKKTLVATDVRIQGIFKSGHKKIPKVFKHILEVKKKNKFQEACSCSQTSTYYLTEETKCLLLSHHNIQTSSSAVHKKTHSRKRSKLHLITIKRVSASYKPAYPKHYSLLKDRLSDTTLSCIIPFIKQDTQTLPKRFLLNLFLYHPSNTLYLAVVVQKVKKQLFPLLAYKEK